MNLFKIPGVPGGQVVSLLHSQHIHLEMKEWESSNATPSIFHQTPRGEHMMRQHSNANVTVRSQRNSVNVAKLLACICFPLAGQAGQTCPTALFFLDCETFSSRMFLMQSETCDMLNCFDISVHKEGTKTTTCTNQITRIRIHSQ